MTNNEIIMAERLALYEQGKLKGTGQYVKVIINDEEREIELPEQIHTYAAWKEMGYVVRKGEHAVSKFSIWKHASKQVELEDGGTEEQGRMFMKKASFFSASQVERLEPAAEPC